MLASRSDRSRAARAAEYGPLNRRPRKIWGIGLYYVEHAGLRRNPRYLTRAKSFDTFFSFGPVVVTPGEVGEVESLEVSTVLNGEIRRTNTVSNLTFSP